MADGGDTSALDAAATEIANRLGMKVDSGDSMVTVKCKRCRQPVQISLADRADMLINGGWVAHDVCPDSGSSGRSS